MPQFVQNIMLVAPTTRFVELGQAMLFRGAGIAVVWRPFLWFAVIGSALFVFSLMRFRKTLVRWPESAAHSACQPWNNFQ